MHQADNRQPGQGDQYEYIPILPARDQIITEMPDISNVVSILNTWVQTGTYGRTLLVTQRRHTYSVSLVLAQLEYTCVLPAFTVVLLNPSFFNTHVSWQGPVTSSPLLLLYWEWVVSITKTGVFWEPVMVITSGGSWVIIHMGGHFLSVK